MTVPDTQPDAGPLAGLVASLRHCHESHLVVLAVDLLRMTPEFLRSLLDHCTKETGAVAMSGDFYEPLAAVYPKKCLPIAEACLAANERRLQNFVAKLVATELVRERPVALEEAPLFSNANTPADLPSFSQH